MMKTVSTILSAAVLMASPAMAWTGSYSADRCAVAETFEDDTFVAFIQNREDWNNGQIAIAIKNPNWSIKAGEVINSNIRFTASNGAWFENKPGTYDNGLLIFAQSKFVEDFTGTMNDQITVTRDGRLVTRLEIRTLWQEWMSFSRCQRVWAKEKQEADRQADLAKLPKDPFAD